MNLYVGKISESSSPVQSVFGLSRSDENALTRALGYLMARDRTFCREFIRRTGLFPRLRLGSNYSIYLQERTLPRYGIPDIVIEDRSGKTTRIVIEAKVGNALPDVEQIGKYARNRNLWNQFDNRAIVALTQVEMTKDQKTTLELSLPTGANAIQFANLGWHRVIDMALGHSPSGGSQVSRFLFQQFSRFVKEDYKMGYYDVEVHVQDVNRENAGVFENGWLYAGGTPAPLYFAPHYTWNGEPIKGLEEWYRNVKESKGISRVARVVASEQVIPAELLGLNDSELATKLKSIVPSASGVQIKIWSKGHRLVEKRTDFEKFCQNPVWFLYLDRPIAIPEAITKEAFNKNNTEKQIPSQIPPGFSLRFDQMLLHSWKSGHPTG